MAKEKKLRKLTRSVFGYKNCPDWAQCAVVNRGGDAYWCRCVDIKPIAVEYPWATWSLMRSAAQRASGWTYDNTWRLIGHGFDGADWKHSMVLRDHSWVEEPPVTASGLPDSGRRESFDTGAVRDDAGDKPRPDLISPFFLERLGEHMRKGAIKYDEWNWAKGIPNSRCYASLMRHLTKFSQGLRDEDHLAAAAFNLMAIIHNEEVAKRGVKLTELNGLVDIPKFERVDDCDSK